MFREACLITGISGEIGASIAKRYLANDFVVIGIDINPPQHDHFSHFILTNLHSLVVDEVAREVFFSELNELLIGVQLKVLVNNAAIQILTSGDLSDVDKLVESHIVNVAAPLLLYRALSFQLKKNIGVLVNIGSIHSRLTKNGFALYASSKAALKSLTQSHAIESEGEILVFSVEPAAIDTTMLRKGFGHNKKALEELSSYHPVKKIGSPEDLSSLVWYLTSSNNIFLHGSCIDLSGGISAVLHDPG